MKVNIRPKKNKRVLNEAVIADEAKRTLKNIGFVEIKKLGHGKHGTVFRATQGEAPYKTIAIKALNKAGKQTSKEVKNYIDVNSARQQDELIAKHFPEVYNVIESNGMIFIFMELLDAEHQGMSLVGDMFSGPESHSWMRKHTMKDLYKHYKSQKVPIMKSDISGRVMQMLISDKKRERLIQNFVDMFAMNVSDPKWRHKELVGHIAGTHGILHSDMRKASTHAEEILDDLYDFNIIGNELSILLKDLSKEPRVLWFILNMVKQTWMALPQQDRQYFRKWLKPAMEDVVSSFRKGADVPVAAQSYPSDEEISNAAPEARSLLKAIKVLAEQFYIIAWDMHDLNALVRPNTGDIVVVDLGNFKRAMKPQQPQGPDPFAHRSWAGSSMHENKQRKIKVFVDRKKKI